jgi:hypothetical protein
MQDVQRADDTVLAAGAQAVKRGTAGDHRVGAKRQRLEEIGAVAG